MNPLRPLLALSAALATVLPALAQEPGFPPRQVRFGEFTPFAALSVDPAFVGETQVLSFYLYLDRPRGEGARRGYAVRRETRARDGAVTVAWAVSHTCPTLEPLLLRLESLPPPRIEVPGLGRERFPLLATDGVSYVLWTQRPEWPDGDGYELQMSSNVNTPLGAWAGDLQQALRPCWSDTAPPAYDARPARDQ